MAFVTLVIASYGLGALVLTRLEGATRLEVRSFRLLLGLCLSAVVIVSVGSVSLRATHPLIGALAVVSLLLWWRRQHYVSYDRYARVEPGKTFVDRASKATVGLALLLALVSVNAPSTGWDAAVAHLSLAADFNRAGHLYAHPGNTHSGYPILLHSLFAYVFAGSGERGVHAVSWLFAAGGCVAVYAIGRRLAGAACGRIAAALLATAPIFFDQAGVAALDLPLAGVIAAALACLLAWRDTACGRWLVLAALLAGSACGIRHTGYLACVLLTLGVFACAPERRGVAAARFGALCLGAALPWLARSALAVGNPFYPFLTGLFPSGEMVNIAVTALGAHESLRGAGLAQLPLFPWSIVMHPERFDGWNSSPGVLLLLLGVPGLFLGGARARGLGAFSLGGLAAFFFFQHYARYLLPFFVPMIPVAALTVCRARALRKPIAALLLFAYAYGLALGLGMVHFKIPAALGLEERNAYRARRIERWEAFAWCNTQLPGGGAVLTLDPRSYYLQRATFQNIDALVPLRGKPLAEQVAWLAAHDIRYLFYPVTYLEQSKRFAELGYLDHFATWLADTEHFERMESFALPSRSGGLDRVAIYRIREGERAAPGAGKEGHLD